MAKDRRTQDQKRKKKLELRKRKAHQTESLAYTGKKYKTKELVFTLMQAEIGIYEAFVMTDRRLLDQTVASALECLIGQIRAGTLPPLEDTSEIHYQTGHEEALVIANVRRKWAAYFSDQWQPPRDKLVGVLRTILGSVETMRSPSPRSRSYLHHIEGFLTKKLGVKVKAYSRKGEPLPVSSEDELVTLGRQWLAKDQHAAVEFRKLVDHLLKTGATDRVIDSCHQLIGEDADPDSEVVAELVALSMEARKSLATSMS